MLESAAAAVHASLGVRADWTTLLDTNHNHARQEAFGDETLLVHRKGANPAHVDENGLITWANLVIATGNNNHAMNQGVAQAAKHYIKNGKFTEGILNRVEAVVRTFDPCLSCSTHAFGKMPLAISLLNIDREEVDRIVR